MSQTRLLAVNIVSGANDEHLIVSTSLVGAIATWEKKFNTGKPAKKILVSATVVSSVNVAVDDELTQMVEFRERLLAVAKTLESRVYSPDRLPDQAITTLVSALREMARLELEG